MKKLTHIIRTGVLLLLTSLSLASCVDGNDWETTFSNRLFGTKSSNFSVTPSAITAEVKWDATPNTEYYIIEVSQEAMTDGMAMGSITESVIFGEDKSIKKSPYTLTGLLGETTYYIRIKSMGQDKESRWVYLADKTFKTSKEQILNSVIKEDITDESLRITWTPSLEVTHLIITIKDDITTQPIIQDITSEEATAGSTTISELTPGTEYVISIYNKEIKRGEITAATNMSELADSKITDITKTSAKLTWDTEIGKITHYAWCEGNKTPTASDHYTALTNEQIAASKVELIGLQPSTTYTIAVMKNSYVRAIQTFTTNKGVPAGFTKVTVTDAAGWNAALANNTGNLAILIPENTELDITAATATIPNTISSLLVWGVNPDTEDKVEIKPNIKLKGFSFTGNLDKFELYNLYLHHDDNSNNFVVYHQGSGNIQNLIMESCKVDKIRGVFRVKNATGSCIFCSITDSEITGIGSYGLFATAEAPNWILSKVSLTNSTINQATGGPLLKSKQETSYSILIDKCTFYQTIYSPLIDNQSKPATINITNTLIGGNGANIKAFGDNAKIESDENLYTTSDFVYHSSYKWGANLDKNATELFEAPTTGNFKVKLTDYKSYGDPRWNK